MKEVLQVNTHTAFNRYKEIFKFVASVLPGSNKLLSFGCSSGDEVFTLSEIYYDNSRILGVDINPDMLVDARNKLKSADVRSNSVEFIDSDSFLQSQEDEFDCIFCMSVFCLWPDTREMSDISQVFPFQKFVDALETVDKVLKTGGFLVLVNTSYSFEDTILCKEKYEIFEGAEGLYSGFVKRFDPNGLESQRQSGGVVFKKNRS